MEDTAIPVGEKDFVQHDKLNEVLSKLFGDSGHHVAVISGVSGAGKSEIALQAKKHMVDKHASNLVSGRLDCAKNDELKNSLVRLKRYHKLDVPDTNNLDDLLKTTCEVLNAKYPERKKLLIFDDVESAKMLYSIDHNVCKHADAEKDKWTIIVTTQKEAQDFYRNCDIINQQDHEVKLKGLSDDEFEEFFQKVPSTRHLSERDKKRIKKKLGRLPVFLQVLRANLDTDQQSLEEGLNFYLCEEQRRQRGDIGLMMLYESFRRIIANVDQKQKKPFVHMIKLLTTIGERRVTRELLIAFAEVVLESNTSYQYSYIKAYDLQSSFIKELRSRSLCDDMTSFSKTMLYNTHNNMKLAMKEFCKDDSGKDMSPEDKAKLILQSLTALTRVMPKDGREHMSLDIFPCLYEHASILMDEVKDLYICKDDIPEDLFVTIRLLKANLHTAMAYCQQTLKTSEETEHFEKAIGEMKSICRLTSPAGDDMDTAQRICSHLSSAPLLSSRYYQAFVDKVMEHSVVTTKDLGFMFDDYSHGDDLESWLSNGFLNVTSGYLTPRRLQILRNDHKLLDQETMRKIYPLELLAEIYIIATRNAKSSGNENGPGVESLRESRGNAALAVCEKVTAIGGNIHLMMETVTRRKLLKIEMLKPNLSPSTLEDLTRKWNALKNDVNHDAYDYGKVRTNFSKDDYHKSICDEQILRCEGEVFALRTAQHWDEAEFKRLTDRFECFKRKVDSKAKKNYMTMSILELNYADFLFSCGDRTKEQLSCMWGEDKELRSNLLRKAIQELINAFIYLRKDLRESSGDHESPEVKNYRKSEKYLLKLKKFFASYKYNPCAGSLLPNPQGEDFERRNYVKETRDYMRRTEEDINPDFVIMFEVCERAGMSDTNPEEGARGGSVAAEHVL
ncbi:uncharacterized protein [Watersipora subatra]|uniref:uncharacterized protein n=1 Tax=Watersipora subatra TaxID=2589382 RepID=UPI00355B8F5C